VITLPAALESHVQLESTTLCFCWKVTRKDSVKSGFTDHDETILFDAVSFEPESGFNASSAESALGLAVSSMDVEGALSSARISEADLSSGAYDGAEVETWLVNWQDINARAKLRVAYISAISFSGGLFKAELKSRMDMLDKRSGRTIRRHCDAELGDAKCKVALAGFTVSASVASVATAADFKTDALGAFADRWFEHGRLTWTNGANAGQVSNISQHEKLGMEQRLVLWRPPSAPIAIGDAFSISAGCDKAFATCKAKFANQLNFQGFPHLPGNDAAYAYVDGEGVFDGAPLVP
jgi:uncharacterized phage protein (TIGR02218 family)